MTFDPISYFPWEKRYPRFTDWALKRDLLFFPKEVAEDEQVDLTSKVYILMKRLGQDYNTIMLMDSDERDIFVKLEMMVIDKENGKKSDKEVYNDLTR